MDLQSFPSLERRAGPESVRVGGHRRALGGDITTHGHRGDLSDDADPSRCHRPGRDCRHPPRGAVRARRWQRRSAQRAHLRRPVALGRGPARHTRGGGISDQCAAPGHEISHRGRHYTVQDARTYTRPRSPYPYMCRGSLRRPPSWPAGSATATAWPCPTPTWSAHPRRRRRTQAGPGEDPGELGRRPRRRRGGCAPPCGPPARRGRRPAPASCPANSPLIAWRGRRDHRVQALTGTQRESRLTPTQASTRPTSSRSGPTWQSSSPPGRRTCCPVSHVNPSCWSSQPTSAAPPWRGADTRALNRDRPTTWAD